MTQTLGTRIKAARIGRKLTQDELADKIGVLGNTVSRWERDAFPPRGVARKWLKKHWPEVYVEGDEERVEAAAEEPEAARETPTGT